MITDRKRSFALLLGFLVLSPGCDSSSPKLYNVSGKVTYNGKPIPAGVIFFDPDPTNGGTGTQGSATIKDGVYTTAVSGIGIRGGAYEVRIMGFDGKPANEAPMGQVLWPGEEFKEKRDLPAQDSELNIDVPIRKK